MGSFSFFSSFFCRIAKLYDVAVKSKDDNAVSLSLLHIYLQNFEASLLTIHIVVAPVKMAPSASVFHPRKLGGLTDIHTHTHTRTYTYVRENFQQQKNFYLQVKACFSGIRPATFYLKKFYSIFTVHRIFFASNQNPSSLLFNHVNYVCNNIHDHKFFYVSKS